LRDLIGLLAARLRPGGPRSTNLTASPAKSLAPEGPQPLILQKAGGLQGVFSYVALAPARGIGVFAAINAFDLNAGLAMAKTANDLIAELAPR
jgi:hypothetical protein